jgi:hypothetical protein
MSTRGLVDSAGYCGMLCAICSRSDDGCPGCRAGGGNVHCVQRQCCKEHRLEGCWQCERFPCDKGYLESAEWRGLCIACVQGIKVNGVEAFTARAESRLGSMVNYEDFCFKDAREIARML